MTNLKFESFSPSFAISCAQDFRMTKVTAQPTRRTAGRTAALAGSAPCLSVTKIWVCPTDSGFRHSHELATLIYQPRIPILSSVQFNTQRRTQSTALGRPRTITLQAGQVKALDTHRGQTRQGLRADGQPTPYLVRAKVSHGHEAAAPCHVQRPPQSCSHARAPPPPNAWRDPHQPRVSPRRKHRPTIVPA